jgi:D-glycero-D-manno-heptose 1,7-bisphosphate phosphatase
MINQWKIDSSWSLFLDRDGVINERIWDGYVLDFKDFIFKIINIFVDRFFCIVF